MKITSRIKSRIIELCQQGLPQALIAKTIKKEFRIRVAQPTISLICRKAQIFRHKKHSVIRSILRSRIIELGQQGIEPKQIIGIINKEFQIKLASSTVNLICRKAGIRFRYPKGIRPKSKRCAACGIVLIFRESGLCPDCAQIQKNLIRLRRAENRWVPAYSPIAQRTREHRGVPKGGTWKYPPKFLEYFQNPYLM